MFRQLGGFNSAGSTAHSFIHGLQQQDDSAWAHYHKVYGDIVSKRYIQAGADAELADELAQQVMVSVLDGIDSYQQDNFRGWLWSITKRRLIDHVRAVTKPDRAQGGCDVVENLEALSANQDWEQQEEEVLRATLETRSHFDIACDSLKIVKSDREIYWNHFNELLTAQQAAKEFNISVAAFYQRKSRLRAEVKRIRDLGPAMDAAVTQLPTGFCIGDYRIVSPLTRSTLGDVYRATQISRGRFVALQVIRNNHISDDDAWQRSTKDLQDVTKLSHPNLVGVYEAACADGINFLAMELVEGRDLAELADAMAPFTMVDACEIVRQGALGLAYLHRHCRTHGDLKRTDLFINRKGQVKVGGFGLDAALLGKPENDVATDVFALGSILFSLLTGSVLPEEISTRRSSGDVGDYLEATVLVAPNLPVAEHDRHDLIGLLNDMLASATALQDLSAASVANRLEPFCTDAALSKL